MHKPLSKKLGYALAIIGFILIVLNAIDYIGGFLGYHWRLERA